MRKEKLITRTIISTKATVLLYNTDTFSEQEHDDGQDSCPEFRY